MFLTQRELTCKTLPIFSRACLNEIDFFYKLMSFMMYTVGLNTTLNLDLDSCIEIILPGY